MGGSRLQVKRAWFLTTLWAGVFVMGSGTAGWGEPPERDLGVIETAFAATMADRDLEGFSAFLDEETIFFAGPKELRGRQAVIDAWSPFFEGDQPPFSWHPEVVSILDSGTLGLTSGPVLDPEGNRIGTFNSIWRKNADGLWKIVFDRGCK